MSAAPENPEPLEWRDAVLIRGIKGQFSEWKKGTEILFNPIMAGGGHLIRRKIPIGGTEIMDHMVGVPRGAFRLVGPEKLAPGAGERRT